MYDKCTVRIPKIHCLNKIEVYIFHPPQTLLECKILKRTMHLKRITFAYFCDDDTSLSTVMLSPRVTLDNQGTDISSQDTQV